MNFLYFYWKDRGAVRRYRTGVSLHSHTSCSRESLSFLPKMAHHVPFAPSLLRRAEERHQRRTGKAIEFGLAYWTPPLPPREALALETRQIQDVLGRHALVSITDHDTLDACTQLRAIGTHKEVPFSVEWTVPFGPACFHLGVHNLPPGQASAIFLDLAEYTRKPRTELLPALLDDLSAMPDVLVVLNHPLSDEGRIGCRPHQDHLNRFLRDHHRRLHALELNALQSWADNREVIELARSFGLPLISGGDRHACEPNGNLNLTNAVTLSEFIAEIRRDRVSNILFMPQYQESLKLRYIENVWRVMKDYPEMPGRTRGSDRVFYVTNDGPKPLSILLRNGGPAYVRRLMAVVGFCLRPQFRLALRLALLEQSKVTL